VIPSEPAADGTAPSLCDHDKNKVSSKEDSSRQRGIHPRRYGWAELLERVFSVDVLFSLWRPLENFMRHHSSGRHCKKFWIASATHPDRPRFSPRNQIEIRSFSSISRFLDDSYCRKPGEISSSCGLSSLSGFADAPQRVAGSALSPIFFEKIGLMER
jgi:hypothetical protein